MPYDSGLILREPVATAALERALHIGNPDAVPGTGRRSKPCKKSLRRNRCWKRHREHRWHEMVER